MKQLLLLSALLLSLAQVQAQTDLLRAQKPNQELIFNAIRDFKWDNAKRANRDEALRLLEWMGADFQHERIDDHGDGFICGQFKSGYHITFWTDTYGKNDRYGVRYGILDANHSYFGSNETYFEITKLRPKHAPTVHLVAVGIGHYQQDYELNPLEFTVPGAYSMRNVYERRNLTSHGYPLHDSGARRSDILSALETLADPANVLEDDMVIFYFSGHGMLVGGKVGICPYDYQSPSDLIGDEDIERILQRSPARHKVCFIEACKNSTSTSADYVDPATVEEFNQRRRNISPGIVFITSTKVGKKSWGRTEGYFTEAIMQALDEGKADLNDDRIITAKELFDYIQPAVKSKTNDEQIPQVNVGYPQNLELMHLGN